MALRVLQGQTDPRAFLERPARLVHLAQPETLDLLDRRERMVHQEQQDLPELPDPPGHPVPQERPVTLEHLEVRVILAQLALLVNQGLPVEPVQSVFRVHLDLPDRLEVQERLEIQALLASPVPPVQSEAPDYRDRLAHPEVKVLRDHKAFQETRDSPDRPDLWDHQDHQGLPDRKVHRDRQDHPEAPADQVSAVSLGRLDPPDQLVSLVLPAKLDHLETMERRDSQDRLE